MFSVILSYLPYALVTAFTPGPNTILSFYTVSQKGWRQGKRAIFGIITAFLLVTTLCALFCYELDRYLPAATNVLKYIGIAYILWLAVHIARSGPDEKEGSHGSFLQGFFLQFVNVKIYLYAITVYTGYVLPAGAGLGTLVLHGVFLVAVAGVSCFTWGAAGGLLQRFLSKHHKPFNYLMAAILVLCAWGML